MPLNLSLFLYILLLLSDFKHQNTVESRLVACLFQPYWGNKKLIVRGKAGWTVSVRELIASPLWSIVLHSAGLTWGLSMTIFAVPIRMEVGIDFGAEGVDSHQPWPWLIGWWAEEITLLLIFVSHPRRKWRKGSKKKKQTITMSCWSHWFSFDASKLARTKFNFEVLITFPCSLCPISPVNLQGFSSPITQHQGYFFQLTVCLCVQTLSKLLWLTDLCVD